ncbi:YceI family protein [Flagellimonas sp.]|uniref:YceI family protein n=1 Tax=Flagellimonas sp. TaxID=2058762 RepID=UPI003F4A26D2
MKMLFPFCFFLLTLVNPFSERRMDRKINSAKITFEFVSKKVKGTIEGFESESTIEWENLENSYFKGSVLAKTLDTNNGLRNWSLRSGKYFDVDDHPKITFESTSVTKSNDQLLVTGMLTIKGTEKEITIIFRKSGQQLIGTTSLFSIDYGIKIKKNREDNLVNVKMIFDIDP